MSDFCANLLLLDSTFNYTTPDSDALIALYCACPGATFCRGICANPDLAGVGVRAAFYAQSVMNALLVFFSRKDSIPSAWAATCLVIALVIPAMVQKFAGEEPQITLHHATLVFNFATLSCISSLAVAPKLPIWRLKPDEYAFRELERQHVLHGVTISTPASRSASRPQSRPISGQITPTSLPIYSDAGQEPAEEYMNPRDPSQGVISIDDVHITKEGKKKIERRQARERFVLSMALLLQVILQWAWGVILFVDPSYSQDECSGQTSLWLFFRPFQTSSLQVSGTSYHLGALWPLWLLFCLFLTLFWTIMLACSGPSQAHDELVLSRTNSLSSSGFAPSRRSTFDHVRDLQGKLSTIAQYVAQIWRRKQEWLQRPNDRSKLLIVANYIAAFVLWFMFVYVSERQIYMNPIFQGENSLMGFGQTAALLLALVPLWSLTIALYKYPAQIRQKRRIKRKQAELDHQREHADRGRRPTSDSNDYFDDATHGLSQHNDPDMNIRDTLRPPMTSAHGRSPSDTSVVSATAPLIPDNIPRMEDTWRRTSWSNSDSDSDSDSDDD